MYNEQMMLSLKKVEANRAANTELQPRRMTADEKDELTALCVVLAIDIEAERHN